MKNKEARTFLKEIFLKYKKEIQTNQLDNINLYKNIISIYITYVDKPEFYTLVDNYKNLYIFNESRVEKNTSKEEQLGVGEMYDYISNFDFSRDYFNLFTTSLILHSKLYSKCAYPEFGGKLRSTTAYLYDTYFEVSSPVVAQKEFNNLIPISDSIFKLLDYEAGRGYFNYIDDCIIMCTQLIEMQPFQDGNKRVFRALLNLLFKKVNIPPIYILEEEKDIYKEALLSAIKDKNYSKIINFYYYKICDAIVSLDINHSVIKDINEEFKR